MDAAGSVPLQLMLQGFWSSANPLLLALRIAEATAIAVTGCGIFFTIVWVARRRRIRTPIDRLAPHPKVDASVSSFRYVADAMPQIVWTASADGALDYCNARWYEYTGMTSAQSLGWGWGPVLHPDDLANCVQVWQHAVEIGTPYDIEYRLKRAGDGAYRWHLGRALPFRDESGSIVRWFGTCTDIDDQKRTSEAAGRLTEQLRLNATLEADLTARKRAEAALQASEQRFRQIEEFTPIGLALVALDGSFLRVNPALCALIGYTCAELVSMTFLLLTHADDLAANLAFMQRTLAGEIANYDMEKRYLHKNGDIVWVRLSACLVRDDAGAPSYFIAQIQDIRARKAVENELRCAQAFTLAAMDAKSRFLATMSHEIRTPMNGIIGMAELLSESSLGVEQRRYVEIVRDSGRSLLRVLNDILDYSKIEAGKFELESVGFSVANQLESVISLLKPQFDANGVRLSTQVDVELPPILEGDPTRLRQIIVNLVGNALKFTPAGGSVRVVVATLPAAVAATQIMVRFAVVDTGVGVAPEVRDRLFRPFSQVDTSTTRKYGGTGLGLSICKQLVDLMRGEIGVDATADGGSSFWFNIPLLRHTGSERIADSFERAPRERRGAVRARSERLLLAEDNDVNAFLATKQFKALGFNVTVVPDGRAAVAAVRREHFDLIFMDCHMPDLDGWAATREIRDLASDRVLRVPIVAMTADAQATDRQACIDAGMDDYISKPASLADLQVALTRWLPTEMRSVAETAP